MSGEQVERLRKMADLAERNGKTRIAMSLDRFRALVQSLEASQRALIMVEWKAIHDPDTQELLGHVCHWCARKPHTDDCPRQAALEEGTQDERRSTRREN